jgi:hypothetical protein
VDFLRALSVSVVVLGHWLGAVVIWEGDLVTGSSALDHIPGLWIVTWLLQVMPIFFFVGGFSNFVTFNGLVRLSEGAGTFLRGRASRLLRPTALFLAFWSVVGVWVYRSGFLPAGARTDALKVLIGPLWFLGVYLVLVILTPLMVPLHQRFRLRLLVVLALLPALVDGLRFLGGAKDAGGANVLFVWLFIHQLGFFYADGNFNRRRSGLFWAMVVGGYGLMIALTQTQTYPSSMVGCCNDLISNMAPPTLAIMALGIGQVGAVMLLRGSLTRWLSRRTPWKLVIAVNGSIMTLFLWHLSALVITVAALYPLGFPQPTVGTGRWWLIRPVWMGAIAVVLSGLLFVFGRFERPDLDPAERYWNLESFYAL